MKNVLQAIYKLLLLAVIYPWQSQAYGQDLASTSQAASLDHLTTAVPVYSQQKVQQSLQEILLDLERRYKVSFNYNHDIVQDLFIIQDYRIRKKEKLDSVLLSILKPFKLKFEKLDNGDYLIYAEKEQPIKYLKQKQAKVTVDEQELAKEMRSEILNFSKIGESANASDKIISGKVVSQDGESLPGVNILVEGTNIGTITDVNGAYQITAPDDATVLVFSYVGYVSERVEIGNRVVIDVSLVSDIAALSEIVVIGYGAVDKSDLTGAVSSLKTEDFNPGANVSVDQLMVGRVAGVQINQTSSEPGGGLSIRVRGASSVNAGNEPLYVIDGFPIDNSALLSGAGAAGLGSNQNPRNPLNALNPNDIESIEVLKDASATAIYGSRGANGVILVTTKKGAKGRVSVNYDVYGGTQSVYENMDLLSTREYIEGMNAISEDLGNGPIFLDDDISRIGTGTDWQEEIYRSAPVWNHNLSASGGDDKTTFFASLNYFDQEGVIKNSGIEKYIARINLERGFGEKVTMGININSSLVKDNNNVDGLNINEEAGPIYSALLYDPTEPIFRSDGSFNQSPNLTINNPVSLIEGISSKNETNRTMGNIYVQYDITSDLNAKLNFGSDRQTARRDIYNSILTFAGEAANGIANIAVLERSNVLLEYTMTYNKTLNENHVINVLGGVTYQDFVNRSFSGTISTFPSDALNTDNLSLGDTGNDDLNSNKGQNSLLSYLGRVNYNLFNKYLFTASMRADGSSRFGENNKFGYFPSFAFGWKLAEEAFIPDLFDDLKLRASWGQTGNQEIGNNASLLTFGTGPLAVFNNQVVSSTDPSRIANPDIKWETTEQFNVGIDASIFDGRISATIDYFIKNTKDMLFNIPLPRATGYNSILSNIGKMENKGFEFLINSTNIITSNFTWNTSFNFSTIKNKVKDLGDIEDIVTGYIQDVGNTSIIREGEPLASYFGFEVVGIFQTDDNIGESAQPNALPGYPIFRDVNGDNAITPADQTIIGNPFPDFTFGIQNSFSYKGFQLDFFIQGQQGADLLNINVIESMYPANFRRNRLSEQVLDRWTPQNTDTRWPSGVNPFAYGGGKVNSLVLQDASYIRLRNVQLSYNVPLENIDFLRSLRVYVTGQNLLTITDYTGFDPEANAFGASNLRIDYSSYPLARTLIFGVNIGL
ncbi:MAG: SusC/RagA family TonB-linked outer membrane protein [Cytophagales bacterium]|nr:SusC/RagA family TonB-linked outer membrane protein [Cytophagales bacterium]